MTTAVFAVRPANADDMDAVAAIYGADVMMATPPSEGV